MQQNSYTASQWWHFD